MGTWRAGSGVRAALRELREERSWRWPISRHHADSWTTTTWRVAYLNVWGVLEQLRGGATGCSLDSQVGDETDRDGAAVDALRDVIDRREHGTDAANLAGWPVCGGQPEKRSFNHNLKLKGSQTL